MIMDFSVDHLARSLVLGALLDELTLRFGGYELVAHWTQGEFHHRQRQAGGGWEQREDGCRVGSRKG
jgi:hypothetical protein